jgi:hypothetical protein
MAQGPGEPLIRHDFKEDAAGWMPIGQTAKVVVFHDPALGAPTVGALRLNYGINKGEFNALLLPVRGDSIKAARSFKFSVKTDLDTVLAVTMQEEEGGRYVAVVHAPKDAWQKVELAVGDFALAMDKDDPKDPNGKLDLELVNALVVADISQLFAQNEDPKLSGLFDVKMGAHTLYFDDFTVGTEAIPPSTSSVGDDVRIDSFGHPQLAWIALGGPKLSRSTGAPLAGPGLKAEYRQAEGKFAILSRSLMPWVLTQAKTLTFDAASQHGAKLIVEVEETEGGKYTAIVDVPAGAKSTSFRLPFTDFKPAEDSKDPDGKLDPGKVKSLTLVDVSGTLEKVNRDNVLWLSNLMGLAK